MKKITLIIILLLNTFLTQAWAQSFVVQNIQIQGLERISAATVESYLPIHRGQTLRPEKTAAIIKALYQTGFFDHISLSRQGSTLIIYVNERPTIGQLKISGNSFIPTDKLTSVMKSLDIAEGRAYNQAVIDRIKQSLLNQYYELGRYNARVEVTTAPMPRNRILVNICISEGLVAKICHINIIGNCAFSEKMLAKQLILTTPGLFTFITETDRYSQEKLEESLENLRNFYLDHGYLKFTVKSAQVQITPDRKSIYLTIVVDEGCPYTVSGIDLAGDLILSRDCILKLIRTKPGCIFSRQAVIDSEKDISYALGDIGYVFATVSVNPRVEDSCRQVFLTFNVKPGKRSYVRHIYFSSNDKTNDEVLRREVLQMEDAVVSTSRLDQSKHQLSLLPFIKDVQMAVMPVENHDDLVDVNYKVTENNSAEANLTVGYSQLYGVQFGAGFNQKNFLGTGKTLGINATTNRYEKFFGINYTNPYFTPDGISRSVSVSGSKVDPGRGNVSASYTLNQFDATVLYSIPITQEKNAFNRLQLGYGYENTLVNLTSSVSQQVQNFVNAHGRRFDQIDIITGISRDSRDKAIFPTSGSLNSLGVNFYLPATSGKLTYYTAGYSGRWYFPITNSFIATAKSQVGYGNSFNGTINFPFFKNYYAGGIDSVRGYLGNGLGPRDNLNKPTGGNLLVTASAGMIFPNYISENLRTTVYVDAGNVYNTYNNRTQGGTASGPLRYSAGLEGDWLTMFGLIDVSIAKALNKKGQNGINDYTEPFQFSLGANFG